MIPKLTLIMPCFNEEAVLPITIPIVEKLFDEMIEKKQIKPESRVLFVDDGSQDKTWNLISEAAKQNERITGIQFSRNFGHQPALVAGMNTAVDNSDCLITMDVDLQDDINAIPEMIKDYQNGSDVVYGVRDNRDTDSTFKRDSALTFYKLMEKLGVKMIPDAADFRLMSQRATRAFLEFKERNLFIRGIVPMVGYPSSKVYYKREPRVAGKTKYSMKKMIALAVNGITSFSIMPLTIMINVGILLILIGLIILIYSLVQKFNGAVVSGWTSLMVSLWVLGGVQLIGLGVVGNYIGKIFTEVKHRPRYIIQTDLYTKQNSDLSEGEITDADNRRQQEY